ncbi:hypothetical protein D6C98_02143 [Aureobasidium pullulans]|uniref:Protein kinase domain-containing protein n=1 Tax=Aureobasidium pullulans TaxID=5580 RepID=A0A4S8XKW9_AURPU|nr:hypothetical protein D6D24_07022 [Aureobasidium pullulans]THW38485.1 hypothetical protein D6D22_06748 [Aureobasidium pullulans]THY60975.1 hypothetical protein D6C98_02143 [Aureobasidium pullulans]
MIDPDYRFWADGGMTDYLDDEVFVMDWDQQRHYTISGPSSFLKIEDEEKDGCAAIDVLRRYMNQLDPGVHTIRVDAEGSLVSTSSNPEEDPEYAIFYPSLHDAPSLQGCPTIEKSKLVELDRFGPGVDLASYKDEDGIVKKVVFKSAPIMQFRGRRWWEINMLYSLPRHPNLVPLDRIVVDNMTSQHILGLTVPYISAHTIHDNRKQIFKLDWLCQLTSVVDFLNLELRVAHQDIAPRNIICLEQASKGHQLQLFDFDRASSIGQLGWAEELNDIKGVIFTLYEIITLDDSYQRLPPSERNLDVVMNLENWPQRRNLDVEVQILRKHLEEWVQCRKNMAPNIQEATSPPRIPEMPKPRPIVDDIDENGTPVYVSLPRTQRHLARKYGNYVISWERPPSVINPSN